MKSDLFSGKESLTRSRRALKNSKRKPSACQRRPSGSTQRDFVQSVTRQKAFRTGENGRSLQPSTRLQNQRGHPPSSFQRAESRPERPLPLRKRKEIQEMLRPSFATKNW